jgi:cation diffusion facilitator CzcD-associated flavoprotein CzcO
MRKPTSENNDSIHSISTLEIMSEKPIQVAVIGAGISGVVTAGHLLAAGIDVTVFERSHAAGGVW